jgi:hypothetical protein
MVIKREFLPTVKPEEPLFHSGSDTPPKPLAANENLAFMGYYPYGEGFLFDDQEDSATPIAEMQRILARDAPSKEAIFPYIGGEEFLDDVSQRHRRFVICFFDLTESEARERYPELMEIVERKVKPFRQSNRRPRLRDEWWRYGEQRPGLQRATQNMTRVLMYPYVSTHLAFAFIPSGTMIGSPHYAFAFDDTIAFALLQSRLHEMWARFFASSLEERLTYTASLCFDTFPRPYQSHYAEELREIGNGYSEFRAALMIRKNEGLTKTYNRFHDPDERSPDILKLRELHAAMDRAVLDAYGWTELKPTCEFLLDYEEDEDEDESGGGRRRKKPWRYRWPDDLRDEVLARLLELNRQRAEEERLSGAAAEAEGKTKAKSPKRAGRKKASDQAEMF